MRRVSSGSGKKSLAAFKHAYQGLLIAIIAIFLLCCLGGVQTAVSAESLDTKLPRRFYFIQPGPLGKALGVYAAEAGVSLGFDTALTEGKTTPGIKGEFSLLQGFDALLRGTGLEVVSTDNGGYQLKKLPKLSADDGQRLPVEISLSETVVKAKRFHDVGPLPGLNLTKEQIAGNIQSISAKEIKDAHSLSLSDLLNSKLQSINVNDYQGNPFQMDITYRGFTAGPQIGTPQGLSVFFDGIRVNEPFGDVVNWDMIPMNALASFDVFPGSNPLFGLNTLGGALSMKTKSGFDFPGVSAEVLNGAYGRKQLQASGGWNNGTLAAFGAVNLFMEDGWRDNSPSKVNQAFGKFEWQGDRASLGLNALAVVNKLVGNGTVPQELYRESASSIFTSPDETRNRLLQLQIAGAFDFNDNINLTGQVYHRDSTRKSRTGDIIDLETFRNDDHSYPMPATRLPGTGSNLNCGYTDTDSDGIPDYYKVSDANWIPFIISMSSGQPDYSLVQLNGPLNSVEMDQALKKLFEKGLYDVFVNEAQYTDSGNLYEGVTALGGFMNFGVGTGYIDDNGDGYRVFSALPKNHDTCVHEDGTQLKPNLSWVQGMVPDTTRPLQSRDGAVFGQPGVVQGTPTAVITNSNIEQSSQGASMQLNFNFDKHKFMFGQSIDRARATYVGTQRLGLLDDSRNVYNDPSQMGEEFYAASHDLPINDFSGKSSTKSVYFSETWTPTPTLNLSASARYNYTQVMNKLAPSVKDSRLQNLHLINRYVWGVICPGSDLANCPYNLDAPISADEYWDKLVIVSNRTTLLDKAATEKFSYYSLNPSLGATWQAKPNLNLYANWNQGTRVPSVIELGCAYDDTLVPYGTSSFAPRSVVDGRGCKLPSALSGDPYLPQVVAQTYEVGARGKFKDFLEWNVSAYRTNVKDDIYMVSVTNELSFFQDVGATRRQGIEFGLAGEYGKSDFRMNYSLTEATFQSFFKMASPNNSSRTVGVNLPDENMIQVQPGNVMPGVPFNNFNFNWGYKLTPDFKISLGLVAHSSSFLRGNENNAHTPSPGQEYLTKINSQDVWLKTPDNEYSGKAPGYAVLNLRARYDIGKGWAAGVMINNLLDKKYYTAGRLGLNPFAPSTIGAIGPGGFNYNSSEWLSSQFISAGAPRGVWATISYDFDAAKKYDPPPAAAQIEPDRSVEQPSTLPSVEELALMKQLQTMKTVPVLNRSQARKGIKLAEQDVKNRVEGWRKAQADKNAQAYLQAYVENFSPPGRSHNEWSEQQKLGFVSEETTAVEIHDLVVAPQGMRMIAVFNLRRARGAHVQAARKVLSFVQKDGQWQIVRETALPLNPRAFDADLVSRGAPTLSQAATKTIYAEATP